MRFSLVMCTVNRVREVARFLASLDAQTYREFELIVVDQSGDDRFCAVLGPYLDRFALRHLRCPLGASRARNVGARAMTGDVLAYPDDDCVYPPDLLERVVGLLDQRRDYDGIVGAVAGSDYWDDRAGPVTRNKIWWQGLDFSMFLRRAVIEEIGGMDERLGPGSGTPWGSCEAVDLLLRAMSRGRRFWYEPAIRVEHPGPIGADTSLQKDRKKARAYAMGKGHVLHAHRYPLWFVGYMVARPVAGFFTSLIKCEPEEAMMYATYAAGMVKGYFS